MRILFASSSSGSQGGGEFYIVYLAKALKLLGHEVGLWLSSESQMDGIAEMFAPIGPVLRQPYTNTYLRRLRSISHVLPAGAEIRSIVSAWNSFNPDFIHLNKQCLEDGLDLLQAAMTVDIPHGCTIHITQSAVELNAQLGLLRDWIARGVLMNYPGTLWAIARNRADALDRFLKGKRKVHCIANGVHIPEETAMSHEASQLREDVAELAGQKGPIAVSVGRLEEQKDPLRFLEIVGEWKRKEPALVAIWVGDGRLRQRFDDKIREMDAATWIHCVGWQETAGPYLSLADIYIHPARFEGLPFALLEAMAHGLPCMISPVLAEDLKDIPKDLWILATDKADEWLPILQDRAALTDLGKRSREIAIRDFSLESMAQAYVEDYQEAIGQTEGSVS